MDGTSLANDGKISEFKNPKKSRMFEELLSRFCAAGLLDAKHTAPEYWKKKALVFAKKRHSHKDMSNQELYDFLDTIENVNFDPTKQASVQRKLITKLKKMS